MRSREDTVESSGARDDLDDEDYEAEVERRYEQDVNPTEEDIEAARADIERAEKLHRVQTFSLSCWRSRKERKTCRVKNLISGSALLIPIIIGSYA